MTYLEKYKQDHPNESVNVEEMCPTHFGYELPFCANPANNDELRSICEACWNTEMPETVTAPRILDSGKRQQFETGAVRDIQEGKGRCDLMPLEVVAKILNGDPFYNPDLVLGRIAIFKNSDYKDTTHLYGAVFHFAERWSERSLDMTAGFADIFLGVAKHFEEGAKKYGENNWQKGISANRYIDSAVRHYLKWLRGDSDEPHALAFVWNIVCCIWEVDFSPRAKKKDEVPFMEKHTVHGYIPVVESDSLPNLRPVGEKVSLEDCPIGPFDFNGVLGLKTEYANEVYTIVGGERMSVNDSDTVQPLEVI